MPLCLTHNQSYNQDEYCVYCGPPTTFGNSYSYNSYSGMNNTLANNIPPSVITKLVNITDYNKEVRNILEKMKEKKCEDKFVGGVTLDSSVNYLSPED